jgi:hypothetical protein
MKQTIWYGNTPNGVRFAKSQDSLKQSGLSGNIGSFTVDGEVTGLSYEDNSSEQQNQSQTSQQHA